MTLAEIVSEIKKNSIEKLVYQGKIAGFRIGVFSPYTNQRYFIDVPESDFSKYASAEQLQRVKKDNQRFKSSELIPYKGYFATQNEIQNNQLISELKTIRGGDKMIELVVTGL